MNPMAEGGGVEVLGRRWAGFDVMLVFGLKIGSRIVPCGEVRTTGVRRIREGVVKGGVPP